LSSQPFHKKKIKVSKLPTLAESNYKIPPHLEKKNLFIQTTTSNLTASTTYFSTSLKVQVIEYYGEVKVADENGKPLTKVYVKCFAKTKSGVVNFYKDGYTDLRGRFEYATLNTNDVSTIEKFALFITSDDLGSLIKEANPPNTIGRADEAYILRSKNPEWQKKNAMATKTGYYETEYHFDGKESLFKKKS